MEDWDEEYGSTAALADSSTRWNCCVYLKKVSWNVHWGGNTWGQPPRFKRQWCRECCLCKIKGKAHSHCGYNDELRDVLDDAFTVDMIAFIGKCHVREWIWSSCLATFGEHVFHIKTGCPVFLWHTAVKWLQPLYCRCMEHWGQEQASWGGFPEWITQGKRSGPNPCFFGDRKDEGGIVDGFLYSCC